LQITISGHHVDVTEGMRGRAYQLADKLIKFFGKVTQVRVIMAVDSEGQIAEFVLEAPRCQTLTAKARATDMYTALDEAAEKLERQLRKHKEKLQERRTRAGRRETM